jgi:carbamoylphosphate synthase large subunit
MIIIFYITKINEWKHFLSFVKLNEIANIIIIDNILDLNNFINDNMEEYKIIPLFECDMIELEFYKNVISPPVNLVKIFNDKKLFNEYVEKLGLTEFIPKTYTVYEDMYDDEYGDSDKLKIIKPPINCNGEFMEITKHVTRYQFQNNLVQEYIPKFHEYTSNIVMKDGKIICCISFKHMFKTDKEIKIYPINTSNYTKIEIDRKYINIMEKFLVGYSGPCNVNYLIVDEKIKIFEINPRIGGTLIRNNTEDLSNFIDKMIK